MVTSYIKWSFWKICDLTEIRLEYERHKVTCLKDYFWYKDWCYSQAATCIKWYPHIFSDEDSKSKYMILATGMKSGHIVLWKITVSQAYEFDSAFLCTVDTTKCQIVSIEWCSKRGMLVIGYIDGQIHGLHFDVNDFSKEPQCTCLFGESTYIKPASLCFLDNATDDTSILVAGMEQCILVVHVSPDGKNVISTSHLFLDNELPFVGLYALTQNTVLMTSHEAVMQKIEISVGEDGIKLKNENLNLEIDYPERYVCQGFCLSPNKVFASFVIRPWPSFDHIDPKHKTVTSRLFVLCVDDVIKGSNCRNSCREMLMNTSEPLGSMTDVLELFRLTVYNDKINSLDIKEEISTGRHNQLQRIQTIVQCSKLKSSWQKDDYMEEINKLEAMIPKLNVNISADWICGTWKHVETLNISYTNMSGTDKSILSAMMLYLISNTSVLLDNDCVKKTVGSMSQFIESEVCLFKCSICKEPLQISNGFWKCNNGHIFSICSRTYLPVEGVYYQTCTVCHMVTINLGGIECSWLAGDLTKCIYCESTMYV
ncbi:hypothetical protein ACF0H5_017965 [Mactra antiquata]